MFVKSHCVVAFCLCFIVMQGCRRAEAVPEIKFTQKVSPQPPRVGQMQIMMTLADNSGKPITRAGLNLEGYMSHSGMPPVSGRVAESGPGSYVGTMDLSMAGDWVVIVHIKLPGQGTVERQFDIKGVLPK